MPLSGQGMLVTMMDVDPEKDQDFNRWYDKEHLADRVILPGFLEARRYVAVDASPRYLNYYTTTSFDVLVGPEYLHARRNHTPWGRQHVPHFRNSTRFVAAVSASRGQGRGGYNAFMRIRPEATGQDKLRQEIVSKFDAILDLDELISLHLLESQSEGAPFAPEDYAAGRADWYWMIEATSQDALDGILGSLSLSQGQRISAGIYRLMWDLCKAELNPA